MKCEEYVGKASPTGQRRQCARQPRWLAQKDGHHSVLLCTQHVHEYALSGWTISPF